MYVLCTMNFCSSSSSSSSGRHQLELMLNTILVQVLAKTDLYGANWPLPHPVYHCDTTHINMQMRPPNTA
jgi:hypothetical protein